MRTGVKIKHKFVEFIPKEREEGVLYVSIPYATAVHNCFCGCGLKVVTPIIDPARKYCVRVSHPCRVLCG
jgi:hypothetical protein